MSQIVNIITWIFGAIFVLFAILTVYEEFSFAKQDKRLPFHDVHGNWKKDFIKLMVVALAFFMIYYLLSHLGFYWKD